MTVNYNETNVSGKKWRRANAVTVTNPLNQLNNAWVVFNEEEVIELNTGELVKKDAGSLAGNFTTVPTFNLLNPVNNEVVGTMTPMELYVALYSLYMHLAQERDNAPPTLQSNP